MLHIPVIDKQIRPVFLFLYQLPPIPPSLKGMPEYALHLRIQEAVGESDGEALGGEEDSADMLKQNILHRGGVCGTWN